MFGGGGGGGGEGRVGVCVFVQLLWLLASDVDLQYLNFPTSNITKLLTITTRTDDVPHYTYQLSVSVSLSVSVCDVV